MKFKTKFAASADGNNEVPIVADETLEDRFVKLIGDMSGRQVVILVEAPCINVHDANGTRVMFTAVWLDDSVLDHLATAMWIASQASLKEIRASAKTIEAFERRLKPIAEGQRSVIVSFSE